MSIVLARSTLHPFMGSSLRQIPGDSLLGEAGRKGEIEIFIRTFARCPVYFRLVVFGNTHLGSAR